MPEGVVVIGGGPGGYVAALRAAQRGSSVTVVEEESLGGVCLNRGCIPTKSLLSSAEVVNIVREAGAFGVEVPSFSLNYPAMVERKDRIVSQLRKGVDFLFQKRGVRLVRGHGRLLSRREVLVEKEGEEPLKLEADAIILATGSNPLKPPVFPFDQERIVSGEEALSWREIPPSLLIVGGGVIGVEMASLFSSLGSSVTIIEMLPRILPGVDEDIGRELSREFKKRKIRILTGSPVESLELTDLGVTAKISGGESLTASRAIVALGRAPRSRNLGLEDAGVRTDAKGFVAVNPRMETGVPGVYAVGDLIGGHLLAHAASHEGLTAAENALGGREEMDDRAIPNCIFTFPEIASVGLSGEEASERKLETVTGSFPFRALGKAQAAGKIEGMVKIVALRKNGEIQGVHLIGAHATDLVGEALLAVKQRLTLSDVAGAVHPHPTFTEAMMEGALSALGIPLHAV
ncbi:MAG: dihydrolipoyl dehydrogenase [bacterium]